MLIKISCPSCKKCIQVTGQHKSWSGACPSCGTHLKSKAATLDNDALSADKSDEEDYLDLFEWIGKIGLVADRNAKVLSGGERQKLAIARALIVRPEILFLDEPTTNLDGRSTREIEDLLREAFQSGTRIIMTTHDIGQAQRLANDVLFLNRGLICERASAKDFFNATASDEAKAFLRGDIVE